MPLERAASASDFTSRSVAMRLWRHEHRPLCQHGCRGVTMNRPTERLRSFAQWLRAIVLERFRIVAGRTTKGLDVQKVRLLESDLDDFVALVDREGGANFLNVAPEWAGVSYTPTLAVDQSLDPFSDAYYQAQVALYREISGRELDQQKNEMLEFDVDRHVQQRNAFGVGGPSDLALHYARLAKLMVHGRLPLAAKVLDMGSGWGLSSEFFASIGCEVTAVDINHQFIELINRRSERLNYGIKTMHGGFDDVSPPQLHDFIVFYECLHHAVRPWTVIDRLSRELAAGGKIAFVGEPVQDRWWKHWGMRLDPISIYCTRKYGWFESGWSKPFIISCLTRAGLLVEWIDDPDPRIGPIAIAARRTSLGMTLTSAEIARYCADETWALDGEYLMSTGNGCLTINGPAEAIAVNLCVTNFRGKPINVTVLSEGDGAIAYQGKLVPGVNKLVLKCGGSAKFRFVSDTWVPHLELGTADNRKMSFHATTLEFVLAA